MHSLVAMSYAAFFPLILGLIQQAQADAVTCTQLVSTTNIQILQNSSPEYSTILMEYWQVESQTGIQAVVY